MERTEEEPSNRTLTVLSSFVLVVRDVLGTQVQWFSQPSTRFARVHHKPNAIARARTGATAAPPNFIAFVASFSDVPVELEVLVVVGRVAVVVGRVSS